MCWYDYIKANDWLTLFFFLCFWLGFIKIGFFVCDFVRNLIDSYRNANAPLWHLELTYTEPTTSERIVYCSMLFTDRDNAIEKACERLCSHYSRSCTDETDDELNKKREALRLALESEEGSWEDDGRTYCLTQKEVHKDNAI